MYSYSYSHSYGYMYIYIHIHIHIYIYIYVWPGRVTHRVVGGGPRDALLCAGGVEKSLASPEEDAAPPGRLRPHNI